MSILYIDDRAVPVEENPDTVTLDFGDPVPYRCGGCGEELTETAAGFTTDRAGLSCPDYQTDDTSTATGGPHIPVPVQLSWCNSAGISVDGTDDSVTLSVSVGDPRGAFVFTIRRVPDDVSGELAGQLVLHVPDPSDGQPHMRLTPIRPGAFLVGDHTQPSRAPDSHAA